ncbi:hypothetical protein BDP27DRAFT_588514 [Rhodocollybia butyracea]|uniref:Uncharacterized protein n=1 Tax=Rhodocollybia butyracea TaxID=206335 RepID=A0A9P5U937_9AGAR|nr:hypothetical protein BDP27DRAFT_588514 [Rhodocollybia butyracea]
MMLITSRIHCFGLVFVAVLISGVHAMPTGPPITPPPPVIAAGPKHLDKESWDTPVRVTVLDENDVTKIYLKGKLSNGARKEISQIVNLAIGPFPRNHVRYMNRYGTYEPIENTIIFAVEAKTGRCSGALPCIVSRLKIDPKRPASISFYEIDQTLKRLTLGDELHSDKIDPDFERLFSLEKFLGGWPGLKNVIEERDNNRIRNGILQPADAERKQRGKKKQPEENQGGPSQNPGASSLKKQKVEDHGVRGKEAPGTTPGTPPPPNLKQPEFKVGSVGWLLNTDT